jgi:uncharacterized protein YndB with AHSA1/START domain
MAAETPSVNKSVERELSITRVLDAPRALVFKAWTTPEHLMRWWGPTGFTCLSCSMDLRVGGAWRLAMRSPAGVEDRQEGVFREITEPERIVFTYTFVDFPERQTSGRWSADSGRPGHQTIVTVNFEDLGAKTRLTMQQAIFENNTVRDEHVRGWGEALDNLAACLVTPAAIRHKE